MQLDSLAFNQYRLKRLDAQAVQGGRTIQHDRVFAYHFFQYVPHFRHFLLDQTLCGLDRRRQSQHFQFVENIGLEQFKRHLLGQAALMQFELRANDDHRTSGVINAFAEQVLAETTAFALDHVGKRLERTLVGAGHSLATAPVVEQ